MISIIIYFSNFCRFFGHHKIRKIRVFYEVMGAEHPKNGNCKNKRDFRENAVGTAQWMRFEILNRKFWEVVAKNALTKNRIQV